MTDRFQTFVLSIHQIYRCIQRLKSQEMTALGLKGTHVMCLFQLGQCPQGLTAAELSTLCLEDKAAVSRALAQLEDLDLVCFQDQGDKRRYRAQARLTTQGQRAAQTIAQRVRQAVSRGGEGLTDDQRRAFYSALSLIARNLTQLCQEGTL